MWSQGFPSSLGSTLGPSSGHAVTVIGRVFATQAKPTDAAIDYVPAYIVHDDQGGPYMLLPVEDPASTPHPFSGDTIMRNPRSGTVELNASHATMAIALMSPRVFSISRYC